MFFHLSDCCIATGLNIGNRNLAHQYWHWSGAQMVSNVHCGPNCINTEMAITQPRDTTQQQSPLKHAIPDNFTLVK